jgi:hypothetical protein
MTADVDEDAVWHASTASGATPLRALRMERV